MIVHDNDLAALMVWSVLGVKLAKPFVGHVLLKDGAPVGAFVVNNYDGINCDITVVGSFWTRTSLRFFADYVFNQLGCVRASARTRASNVKAIKALDWLGFQPEGIQRFGFGDEDAIRFGLLRTEEKLTTLRTPPNGQP